MGFELSNNNKNRRPVMSDINVTPLVDVMLVLLVIFMITTPLLEQGIPLDLPEAKTTSLDPKDVQLMIEITKNKDIFVDKQKIDFDALEKSLMGNEKLKRREVFIRADRTVPYGFVAQVMAIVKSVGISRIGLVTEPAS